MNCSQCFRAFASGIVTTALWVAGIVPPLSITTGQTGRGCGSHRHLCSLGRCGAQAVPPDNTPAAGPGVAGSSDHLSGRY